MPESEPRLLLDVKEVSRLTGFSVGTLYHWVSQRRVPFVRLSGRCIRFRPSDLEAWLAEKVEAPREGWPRLSAQRRKRDPEVNKSQDHAIK